MKNYLYMIQASTSAGDVAFTIYANTAKQMQQEVLDAVYDGYVVSVVALEPKDESNENN